MEAAENPTPPDLSQEELQSFWYRHFELEVFRSARLYATAFQALEAAIGTTVATELAPVVLPDLLKAGSLKATEELQQMVAERSVARQQVEMQRQMEALERLRQTRQERESGGAEPW